MTRAEAVERVVRHAARLPDRATVIGNYWDTDTEPYRQAYRADIADVLDESGYPAALDAAEANAEAYREIAYSALDALNAIAGGYETARNAIAKAKELAAAALVRPPNSPTSTEGTP